MGYQKGDLAEGRELDFAAALDWLSDNTDFRITDGSITEVAALPPSARLFILKFMEIMSSGGTLSGVSSESIGGMSKSYAVASDMSGALMLLIRQLLRGHYTGGVKISMPRSRWV
nr:MAG TPA: putative head-tail connector protein [Caudoviricetes sp.]